MERRTEDQIMATMAANEGKPGTELERFFARLKSMTIDGYYTSAIGIHQDLQYKGNTAVAEFPGCTHPEHLRDAAATGGRRDLRNREFEDLSRP